MIFQTYTTWSNKIYSLKYSRSANSGCTDRGIKKLEFVVKTQFLYFTLTWTRNVFCAEIEKLDFLTFKDISINNMQRWRLLLWIINGTLYGLRGWYLHDISASEYHYYAREQIWLELSWSWAELSVSPGGGDISIQVQPRSCLLQVIQ